MRRFPSVFRLWAEDSLLRRPLSPPLPPSPPALAARQLPSSSPLPLRELLTWLAGGPLPLVISPPGGRWLEFRRPLDSTSGRTLLGSLLGRWIPALVRRDLPVLVRFNSAGGVVVLRDWGELNLPLPRDYFGLRLPVRFLFPGLTPPLLTLFRLRP